MLNNETFIIAEAGVNHNGNIEIAKKLVDSAKIAGADAVKFQTFCAEKLVVPTAGKAEYQVANTGNSESQQEMLRKLQLKKEEYIELKNYCEKREIMFISTPFDVDSLRFLISIGVSIVKIPSGEITNFPLLREAGKSGLDVILSTGMSVIEEVQAAVNVLKKYGCRNLIVLQCNTEYPTPYEDANLRAMQVLGNETGCRFGYSDHTSGNDAAIAAVALGACVIEKHFTLSRSMDGPDHIASIEPDELKQLVASIRNVEKALGSEKKEISKSEMKNRDVVRKSIVANCNIKKGDVFTEENITSKRPGTGISPMMWEKIIGSVAMQDFEENEEIII